MKKAFCFDICSCHYLRQNLSLSDLTISQVTSVQKRESRKHFSASAYGLGLKKLFLGFLFSTSVTWEKLKSDVEKFYFRRDMEKNQNKILFWGLRSHLPPYCKHLTIWEKLYLWCSIFKKNIPHTKYFLFPC